MSEREFTSAAFQRFLSEHKLMGSQCQSCGALYLPPRPLCTACHDEDMAWTEMSGRGRLLAFTTIHIAPTIMIEAGYGRDNPYCTGVVQLEEGPAISAQILGVDAAHPESIAIGTTLQVAFVAREAGPGGETRTYLAFQRD
jgi:uncharacterized OB-fold protein